MTRSQKSKRPANDAGVSFNSVRQIAGELAGATEKTSYGTPAFYVGKTLFVRQHQDGESLVVRINPGERALLVKSSPTTYSVTEHYQNYPFVLVRMASVEREELRELLVEAWRLAAAQSAQRQPQKRKKG